MEHNINLLWKLVKVNHTYPSFYTRTHKKKKLINVTQQNPEAKILN